MGDQLRFTPSGPRTLTDSDFRPDGRPKTVMNPIENLIRTPATFDPIIPQERLNTIRQILEARGAHLKGKARTRGESPNPPGGRIYDRNCGWLMYRHARRGRWGYQCGLYQNSHTKCCTHNVVGGEATTAFVMSCLRQRVLTPTALTKLEAWLRELAESESGDQAARQRVESDRSKLATLEKKIATVGRNMALADMTEERAAMAQVFRELQTEATRVRTLVQNHRPLEAEGSPEREVKTALAGLDRLVDLAKSGSNHAAIGDLFRRLDIRLYLRFRTAQRGRQKTSVINGGVVTFGATPPPSPLYDGPTGRAIIRQKLASGEPVSSVANQVVANRSSSAPEVQWSAHVQRGTSRRSGPRTAATRLVLSCRISAVRVR